MIKTLFFLFLLFPIIVFCQNDTIISGKVVSESNNLEGIHVINISKKTAGITDARGYFKITAKISDTLQFSAVHLNATQHVIREIDFKGEVLFIQMKSLISQLDEVILNGYKNINAVSLGIVPANQRTYTPAERKLYTAGGFEWYSPLLIPLGGMDVDGMINAITGRTAMLEKALVIEKKEMLQAKTTDYFEPAYFTETLKIPKEYVEGFLFYIAENAKYAQAMKDKNKTMATFILSELAAEFIKLKEL